ncbi:MAG: sulfatase-like hydrolase/transferase [Paracoccaceae bacterium]|nr:sulfatase-like hydrolase/transferase [Paracoccaceae bacterium]
MTPADRPRNVLLLMVDEMAWWAPGFAAAAGKAPASTPCLDRLAKRSVIFDSAYTPSPMCVPARAAIACGRHVHETRNWSSAEAYRGQLPSFGHRLRDRGIGMTSIGKLHYRRAADDVGIDEQIEPLHIPNGIGWVRGLLRRPLCGYDATSELAETIGPGETDYVRFDRRVTAAACHWLEAPGRRDRPWCCFVSWLSPHYPLVAPPEFFGLYDPGRFAGAPEPVPGHPVLRQLAGFFDHDRYFSERDRGIARAAYRGLCSFVDGEIGKTLDSLSRSGQERDTLVIFTSDHGEMLGAKGFWGKSTMYEDSVRVPLLLAGPGADAGTRRNGPVSLIDIAPTVCEALGVPQAPAAFSGLSLLAPDMPERAVISEYHDGGCSDGITMLRLNNREGAWKYVDYAGGHGPQLFDLRQDPEERQDLAATHPGTADWARRRLLDFLDPEETNERAHADQERMITALGGREHLLGVPQWNYTPV